jgi:flagellar motility protein MotE (MotC chaperone)
MALHWPRLPWPIRLRLLPAVMVLLGTLAATKLEGLLRAATTPDASMAQPTALVAPAQAQAPAPPATPAPTPAPTQTSAPPQAPAAQPAPEAAAERAVLEALRNRRAEIEAREQAALAREQVVIAAERRLAQRVEELTSLQRRLEALERERAAREDAGLRGLVKLYEGMRPRDAALIFDELEMPVLVRIVDRMREAKAAPVMGAMRPDRARGLTAELARLRAERIETR